MRFLVSLPEMVNVHQNAMDFGFLEKVSQEKERERERERERESKFQNYANAVLV